MTADELREAFSRLPPIEDTGDFWEMRRATIRQHVALKDPRTFLQWSDIEATMFVGDAPYVHEELKTLRKWHGWPHAVVEDSFPVKRLPGKLWWTSGNLIHQAYHLLTWEAGAGRLIEKQSRIVEIGGGYGALAKVTRRLGFTGAYVIYDLPEMTLLQRYYLTECGITDVDCRSVLPAAPEEYDLFIGLWSLSEMAERLQDTYLNHLRTKHYLLAVGDNAFNGYTHARLDRLGCKQFKTMIPESYYLVS